MDSITLVLTTAEAQLIVEALADRPFRQSAGLIQKIQFQAQPQVEKQEGVNLNGQRADSTST